MQPHLYANKLIKEYSEKQTTKLDELKALDKKVRKPVVVFAYALGVLASLILGTGMCLAMKIIGSTNTHFILGIAIGVFGIFLVSVNYFIFNKMMQSRKRKHSLEIIRLSNEVLNEN